MTVCKLSKKDNMFSYCYSNQKIKCSLSLDTIILYLLKCQMRFLP